MTEISNNVNQTNEGVEYVTFWKRAGAYIMDIALLSIVAFIVNAINIAHYKSFSIYLIVALISILYKPFLESKFGATLGKMVLNIKVTDYNFNRISFSKSLLRSFILILPAALYIPFYYLALNNPNLAETATIMEFAKAFAIEYPLQSLISNLTFGIILAEIIVLLTDSTKTQRSLHDRIAKTYVIYDKK